LANDVRIPSNFQEEEKISLKEIITQLRRRKGLELASCISIQESSQQRKKKKQYLTTKISLRNVKRYHQHLNFRQLMELSHII